MNSSISPPAVRPLKRKLLVPFFAAGIVAATVAIVWFHTETSFQAIEGSFLRGEAVANILKHAGGSVLNRDELERLVEAIGHDQDLSEIAILSGDPLQVVVSTKSAWIGQRPERIFPKGGPALARAAMKRDTPLRLRDNVKPAVVAGIPVFVSESMQPGHAPSAGVVWVQLNQNAPATTAATRNFALTFVVGFLLLTLAGYVAMERIILDPIARIRRAVMQGRASTPEVWADATTNDELGALAETLRESLGRRDAALRELESFKYALDQHTLVAVTDPQGTITYVNDRFCGVSGYPPDELLGQNHRMLSSGFHPPGFFVDLWSTVARGAVWHGEICNRAKNGELYWDETSIVPLLGSDGKPLSFISIRTSVTARKRSEAALMQERFLMQALMTTLPDNVYFKDRASRIIRINDAKARSHGLVDPSEAVGKTDFDYFSEEHAKSAYMDEQRILQTGETLIHEERETWPDRPDTWVATTKMPLRDAAGEVVGTFGISRDITTQKSAEAALREAKEAAESANRAKSDFLATMSHEIRTPMNVVLGFTDLLIETPLQTKQREFVELIRTSGRNLVALINDILDFSKIEAGKLHVEETRVDALAVAEDVVRTFASHAQRKGLWLAVRRVPDVPRILVGDGTRLRQVLTNLVGNALKFTTTGGVTLTVGHGEEAMPARLRLTVTDTGIGIPGDKLGLLFNKFTQADSSTTRQFGGTGLGLAISKCLVELMGGTIGVTSEPGSGASFWCELPLSQDQQSPIAPLAGSANPPELIGPEDRLSALPSKRKRRVLVVDDNELNQHLAASFLQKLGCESVLANNGQEAVGFVQWQDFDLIIMDHQMPVMDGCEAAGAIRQWERAQNRSKRIPILAVTANAAPNSHDFYCAAGMDGYLAKPITRVLLAQAMNSLWDVTSQEPVADRSPTHLSSLPSAVATPPGLVDHARALQQVDQNPALLALLAQAFNAQCDELILGIEGAIRDHDAPGLKQQAHKLKGSVSTFAADRVWSAAKALETMAETGDWTKINVDATHLIADVRQLREELTAISTPSPTEA